jgi:hypothetical protein
MNPRQSRLKDVRIKAIGNRIDARVWDDLNVFTALPYSPFGLFVQFSNVAANLSLDCLMPGERAVATPVEQLVNHSAPRGNRHSPLIWPLSEPLTDHAAGGLKFRDHA